MEARTMLDRVPDITLSVATSTHTNFWSCQSYKREQQNRSVVAALKGPQLADLKPIMLVGLVQRRVQPANRLQR